MKKLFISLSICLLGVSAVSAQAPFQVHYENQLGFSGDHYSIATATQPEEYAYACAGSYFDQISGEEKFHVFTTDEYGGIVWETHLDQFQGRILDVTVTKNMEVAVTGFTGDIGSEELYVGLFYASGGLMTDISIPNQNPGFYTAGTSIFSHEESGTLIVGGIEYNGNITSPTGQAIYLSLNAQNLNLNWINQVYSTCLNGNMSSINDITGVGKYAFLTGTINTPAQLGNGFKQVLGLLINLYDGSVAQNLSHMPDTGPNHRAMGTSAHYNTATKTFHWMYNVSVPQNYITDETRPYILNFKFDESSENPLVFNNGFKLQGQLGGNVVPGFPSNPNVTGLTIIPANEEKDYYVLSGIVESYGSSNDEIVSFYQILDLNTGVPQDQAQLWSNSYINTDFPVQGSFYSFINQNFLNADIYTPSSTTLGSKKESFVSIVPSQSTTGNLIYTHDLVSASLNPGTTNSNCLTPFKWKFIPYTPNQKICMVIDHLSYNTQQYGANYQSSASLLKNTCDISGKSSNSTGMIIEDNKIMKIYPNPAFETLNLNIFDEGSYTLEITNLNGQSVYTSDITFEGSFIRIDIGDLHSGIYFLKATSTDGSFEIEKFIKE